MINFPDAATRKEFMSIIMDVSQGPLVEGEQVMIAMLDTSDLQKCLFDKDLSQSARRAAARLLEFQSS